VCGRLERIREGGARPERTCGDDRTADLRHDVPSGRGRATFELGEALQRLAILDAVQPQQHRPGGGSGAPALPPQVRGPQLSTESPRVVAQHLFPEGRMDHAGTMFWFSRNTFVGS